MKLWYLLLTALVYVLWCPHALAQPATPTGVQAVATGPTSIQLTWQAIPDAVAYKVTRQFVTRYTVLSPTTSTTLLDTQGITGQHHYKYRVVAIDAQGRESPPSVQASAMTLPAVPFGPCQRVRVGERLLVRDAPAGTGVGYQPVHTLGTITAGPETRGINPALTWWRVDWDTGVDGWVADYILRRPR